MRYWKKMVAGGAAVLIAAGAAPADTRLEEIPATSS
jgi:hypothetical protein